MRFNCQSCAAKYQIADEKVAGKTVRMKCRKCGTLIQVKAQQSGSSVTATHVDPNAPPSSRSPLGGAAPASVRRPPARQQSAPRIAPLGARPLPPRAPAAGRLGGAPRPAGVRDRAAPPARPRPGAERRPAPAAQSYDDEATVVMMRPSEEELERARPRPAAGARAPSPKPGPAAGARAPSPKPGPASAGRSDWYVGIGGSPVGPVTEDFLKEQISLEKVGGQSLVWHEGMTDWKPLNSFAQLRSMLSQRRPPVAPPAQVSDPVALTRVKDGDQVPAPVSAPVPAPDVDVAAPRSSQKPAAAPLSSPAPLAAGRQPPVAEMPPESAEAPPMSVPPDSAELAAAGIPVRDRRGRRRKVNPMAYAFIAMATAFGAVAAWFLFASGPPVVDPNQPVGSTPGGGTGVAVNPGAPGASGAPAAGTAIEIAPVDVDGRPIGGPFTTGRGNSSATPAESVAKVNGKGTAPKPCSPDDPFCDKGPAGPSTAGGSEGSGESGQGLSPSQAQATVGQYKGSLMRRCRSLVTKGSAKVAATIVVGKSGAVKSVSVSGGSKYPGLASCVKSRIQNWSFPASGADTTINVSFNFL